MVVVHFFENKSIVLTQLRSDIPAVDENIKIKGRKGIIISVKKLEENTAHAQIVFEKVKQTQQIQRDSKKKKR